MLRTSTPYTTALEAEWRVCQVTTISCRREETGLVRECEQQCRASCIPRARIRKRDGLVVEWSCDGLHTRPEAPLQQLTAPSFSSSYSVYVCVTVTGTARRLIRCNHMYDGKTLTASFRLLLQLYAPPPREKQCALCSVRSGYDGSIRELSLVHHVAVQCSVLSFPLSCMPA